MSGMAVVFITYEVDFKLVNCVLSAFDRQGLSDGNAPNVVVFCLRRA